MDCSIFIFVCGACYSVDTIHKYLLIYQRRSNNIRIFPLLIMLLLLLLFLFRQTDRQTDAPSHPAPSAIQLLSTLHHTAQTTENV